MESKSIYRQFYNKLIIATSLFIITLSFIFYEYARSTVYDDIQENMLGQAKQIQKNYISFDKFTSVKTQFQTIDVVKNSELQEIKFFNYQMGGKYYIKLLYPFNLENKEFLQIIKNISLERELLYSVIFKNLFILAIPGFILMLLYSLVVSKSLLKPIMQINKKLANMDEHSLSQIDTKDLPIEFHSLANSINSLTNRIGTYVKFKKELFIGAAHELKTPLAVMKLKNEVTLKKKREIEQYEETLRLTIKSIDDMNIMISSILDIGRTEGAQFEQTTEIDLVEYIKKKANDYRMLSAQKNIIITFFSNVNHLNTSIQLTLFNQILQNFVQNAIKFTPNEKTIDIRLRKTKKEIIITVTDEGIGIDENIDLFAPFKRVGNQSGVGLGLFLAKNAADALRANISIKNREDGKSGCVAKLILNNTSKND
ncbi:MULTISPECIES: HAMP domain-containing sensor histidine kinase [Arcobacter]|jgi:two-component system OmpR family sensor kinase|uniref:histidine kinase n=1 Tax=Arcobacter ellisii TaxID=913109 RepID=A0A347U5S1_9BACT|nr:MULTISPECIES: HAMP domain-containing sensor histidine kinase [Arcobacter]AXX94199.1 two-component system sensor histidine kinase [Arcobacter ellisii]MDY3203499.1 HAMP domain-containing sensor histidine kinase [Arcobacter sp.]RXI32555.1 two-component sensor histidine kinase [Arcobacter ellisii]